MNVWIATARAAHALLLVLLAGSGAAYDFQQIAVTGAPVPDGSSTFAGFSTPAYREGRAVFRASTSRGGAGIYSWSSGHLVTIADFFAPAPGGGWFTGFGSGPDTSEQVVVFQASGTRSLFYGPSFQGIYRTGDGGLSVVAESRTEVPGGSGTFSSFGPAPRIGTGGVVFAASSSLGQGLYFSTYASLLKVADTTTVMPGHTETFAAFHGYDLDASTIAFVGESASGFRGIYLWRDGGLSRAVDAGSLRPGGAEPFSSLGGQVALRSGAVVFSSATGVYAWAGGSVRTIMDFGMNPPLEEAPFDSILEGIEVADEAVFFSAASSSRRGIHVGNGHNIWTVADNNRLLDGRTVHSFSFGNEALDSRNLAFKAEFSDGTGGLYVVSPVRVPVGSWFNTLQPLHAGGAGGFQVLHYNFTLGSSTVTPYATAPARAALPLSRGQWAGMYLYDYSSGRFSQAAYRYASSGP